MLKRIVKNIMAPRHFWREDALGYAALKDKFSKIPNGFDELSELYVNAMLRGLALSITGLFIPIYLLTLGYSFTAVLSVVAFYFTFRGLIMDVVSGYVVAKIGPKHSMLTGYFVQILSSAMFLTLGSMHWPLWSLAFVWSFASSMYFIPFNVGFSKVKHTKYGGKELGYLNIMSRIGQVFGPIIGAVVATVFGPQYIFLAAGILLLLGSIPLLSTAEPVRLNQKLDFKGFRVGTLKVDIISFVGVGSENSLYLYMWPLFLGLFILSGSTVYAKLGFLASLSVVLGAIMAYVFGKLTDKGRGRHILRFTAVANSFIYLVKIFTNSFPMAFGLNLSSEAVSAGYRVAYFKGYYDAPESYPGYRIVYMCVVESITSIARATQWWMLVILSVFISALFFFLFFFFFQAEDGIRDA